MPDEFESHAPSLTAPARHAQSITPSDSIPLTIASRALYVGQAGNLRVQMVSGDTVTLTGVQAGMVYPLRVTQVLATGTTAGAIIGLH